MKNFLFSLLGICLLITACKKDDNCDDSSLSTTVIGSWDVIVLGFNTGTVEFESDGTLVDEDDALVGGEIGGEVLDMKTWVVTGNNRITVEASNGSSSVEIDIDVDDYDCDEINGDAGGFPVTLKRD